MTAMARSRASPPATWASARTASRRANFAPGMELHGRQTLFAEGARGSLTKTLLATLRSRQGLAIRRSTASGSRNCGRSSPAKHRPGLLIHTVGWPLDQQDLWRVVPLSPRRQSGRRRLRRRAWLQEPVSVALRGIPALQDASGDPAVARRRQAHLLWRAGDLGGRPASRCRSSPFPAAP